MGNLCSSTGRTSDRDSASNSESSQCCRVRSGRRKKSSITNIEEIKQDPAGVNGNNIKESSATQKTSTASVQPVVVNPREESSMASVDSEWAMAAAPPVQQQQPPPKTKPMAPPVQQAQSPTVATPNAATVPDALRQLPESVRQALHGCVPGSATAAERGSHLTVYITSADPVATSSTSSGLIKSLLGESGLRQLAGRRGASLQILSDPWGTGTPSSSDDRTSRISISNLNRLMETSHVIPVLLFGDTLGRPCLPLSIEAQDFQSALDAAQQEEDRSLVETWYRPDAQAQPPCYRLQSASSMGEEVQRRLLEIFITVFNPELSDAYLTTLFEQEVHNSVCMSQEMARRCVWIQESSSSGPVPASTPSAEASIAERENRRRVNAVQKTLKTLLQEKHIIKCQGESAMANQLAATLRSIVGELLDELDAKDASARCSIPRPLLDEIQQHLSFCQRAATCSVNRESALMAIKRYLTTSNDRHPLIVYGAEGSGKTCLMARAAQHCHSWIPSSWDDSGPTEMGLVLRFARLTPDSGSVLSLLHSITRQVSLLVTGRLPQTPHSVSSYQSTLNGLLDGGPSSTKRCITFILDGLDHLEDFDGDAAELLSAWLPAQLPANIKVVLSVRSGEWLDSMRKKLPDSVFYLLEELSPSEAHNLFDACLLQHAHRSHGDHLAAMAAQINQSHRPLTVKILSWQAGVAEEFRSEHGGDLLPCSTNIIPNLFAAMEELTGLQKDEVGLMMAMLTSSRFGLCDYEMEQLCRRHLLPDGSQDDDKKASCWPTLAYFLGPFLQRTIIGGLGLLTWRDVTLRQQMMDTFLAASEAGRVHRMMLDYYWALWTEAKTALQAQDWADLATPASAISALRLIRRALDEIPHHLSRLGETSDALERWKDIWSPDFCWLLTKLAASGMSQVLEDLALTPAEVRPSDSLQQWLILSAPALDYDYRQLGSQLAGRGGNALPVRSLVPCLMPNRVCLAGNQSESKAADQSAEVCTSAIFRLSDGEEYRAAVLSAVKDEMSLWDFAIGQCDKVLGNLQNQPLKVAPLSNNRCVMLCGRELRIYDMKTGEELLKLKGMMNQKLPLFGLHGDSHVVSLSRNRMYVNLISLETGDCVTTFKVGEDRFLNSLLVSENGRILVCGDESKRPCSLLVWDLQAKKLIYDLKMLHHEFTTRLSAITGDGTYVACVCKELETSDPDFLVVYDLQSGTLFKKWKQGANTVALAIACQNTCVITSLQDGRILVWDLGTGNCRWSLIGHSTAIDMLTLDLEGFTLLSWDSRDHDRSIRVWNLNTGQDIATFTPDRRITAAQLSADGRVILMALAGQSDLIQLQLYQPT